MSRSRQQKRNEEKAIEHPEKCRYHKFEPRTDYIPPILTPEERKRSRYLLANLLGICAAMDIKKYY